MPFTYQQASREFDVFLDDLLAISGLTTSNQAYTLTRSVFIVFRSHVTPQQALDFAQLLPAVLRAIFVEDWDLCIPVTPFGDREQLTREVQFIREAHNFSPSNAIVAVAQALKNAMTPMDHEFMLSQLPKQAKAFWTTGESD